MNYLRWAIGSLAKIVTYVDINWENQMHPWKLSASMWMPQKIGKADHPI